MSSLVVKHLPLLELLTKVNTDSRHKILKHCHSDLIKAIEECVFNVLKRNVLLKQKRIEKLKKYKNILRKIGNSKTNINQKKKLIIQSGGNYLPILLKPIVLYLFDKLLNNLK